MGYASTFHILALDGGGTRGIYPAHVLARIEEQFDVQINVQNEFEISRRR